MKKKNGFVIHNGIKYEYEVDENGYVWILKEPGKLNIGQVRPISYTDNIEEIVHDMLDAGGY